MKGRVIDVNHRNGLVAVQLENGECSIFEPLGGYSVEIGDIISGEIDFDGGENAYNHSQDEPMDIITEFSGLALQMVKRRLYP
jgi:hypothetical protein